MYHITHPQMNPSFPAGFRKKPQQLRRFRDHRSQGSTGNAHFRKNPESENKNRIEKNIQHHGKRTDHRTFHGLTAVLQDAEENLGDPCHKVGQPHHLKIPDAAGNQHFVPCKNPHQQSRAQLSCQKDRQGHRRGDLQHQSQNPFHRIPVTLSPVLSGQHASPDGHGRQKQIEDKLHLSGQGDGRKRILIQQPQHQSVGSVHCRQHELLKSDRKHQRK